MEGFRTWLATNKIFFETIATVLLALAAIVVSVVQTRISNRQNALVDKQTHLAEFQTRIAEAQAMPTFDIRIVQQRDEATQKFDDNFLTIDNLGGPVRDFEARAILIVDIATADKGPPVKAADVKLHIAGYFAISEVSAVSKGHLVTMVGKGNNRALSDLAMALRAEAESRAWAYSNTEEKIYLRLDYKDILDRQHSDYYVVDPAHDNKR